MAGAEDATTTTARLNLSTMVTVVLKYLEDNIFEVRTVTTGYPVPAPARAADLASNDVDEISLS